MTQNADTPLLQLGRRIDDISRQHQSFDIGGSARGTVPKRQADHLVDTLGTARGTLLEAVCSLPAQHLMDVLVQLGSAFVVVDCLAGSDRGEHILDELHAVRAALASSLRVVLDQVPDGTAPGRGTALEAIGLVFHDQVVAPALTDGANVAADGETPDGTRSPRTDATLIAMCQRVLADWRCIPAVDRFGRPEEALRTLQAPAVALPAEVSALCS